jgi:Mn2+/Fe2+ NRAMP family transporter
MTIVGTIVVGWISFLKKRLVQANSLKEIKIIRPLMFFLKNCSFRGFKRFFILISKKVEISRLTRGVSVLHLICCFCSVLAGSLWSAS